MIFLLQRTGQGKNFSAYSFCLDVDGISFTDNWAGRELPHSEFFCMDVNDIFITENWAGQELLRPTLCVCM